VSFSVLEWQCPNIRGENPLIAILMVVLGCFFLPLSFHRETKVGPAISSQSGQHPARIWHRIILGFVGAVSICTGTKIVQLCQ